MIKFKHSGGFDNSERFLRKKSTNVMPILQRYANEGLQALISATPKDTGLTAESWNYRIVRTRNGYIISWDNSHLVAGIPVAILLQYGHGTRGGTFVPGRDYINPSMRPIFDAIADKLWKEVTS